MAKKYEIDFDFDALEAALYSDLAKSFTSLQLKFPDESIYNFTFHISEDMVYVTAEVMTESGLHDSVTEARERLEKYRSVDFDIVKDFYRHNCTEDVYTEDKQFWAMVEKANQLLGQFVLKTDRLIRFYELQLGADPDDVWDSIQEMKQQVLDICERVMNRLDEAKVFELTNRRENVTLQIRHGDSEPDLESVRRLNPREVYDQFLIDHRKYLAARKLLYGY